MNTPGNPLRSNTSVDAGQFTPAAIYRDGKYIQDNQSWHAEDSSWKARQVQTILRRNGVVPSEVCEIGCGAGGILRELSLVYTGASFVGYEISPQAIALCNAAQDATQSSSISYRTADIFENDEIFDCLLCIDVFEHVEDYMGFLVKLRSKARLKVFHIPLDISILSILHSSMMRARRNVGHLHYFTRETAIATLTDCGYRVIDGFFTAPFNALEAKSFKSRLARLPRKAMFAVHPEFASRVVGGCSYLVLAE